MVQCCIYLQADKQNNVTDATQLIIDLLLMLTTAFSIIWVCYSVTFCVCVRVCVCPYNKTKTAETKITKLICRESLHYQLILGQKVNVQGGRCELCALLSAQPLVLLLVTSNVSNVLGVQ